MNIIIIVAHDENNVIGVNNDIPWKIPSDLKNFKKITSGSTVVMGRKTYESIGRPLPKRRNIVLTTNKDWIADGVEVAHSVSHVIGMIGAEERVFIIGGEGVYKDFLPFTDTLCISHVVTGGKIIGDAYFPKITENDFLRIVSSDEIKEEKDECAYTYAVYERRSKVEEKIRKQKESQKEGEEND